MGTPSPDHRVLAMLGCLTHLWGAGYPDGLWGSPAEPREGAARTELGLQRLPGQAARGIALELALAMPRASCPGCPTSPPCPPTLAPHCPPAVAPRGGRKCPRAPAPLTAAALSRALLGPPAPYLPRPLALAGLAAPPRPPQPLRGQPLGAAAWQPAPSILFEVSNPFKSRGGKVIASKAPCVEQ